VARTEADCYGGVARGAVNDADERRGERILRLRGRAWHVDEHKSSDSAENRDERVDRDDPLGKDHSCGFSGCEPCHDKANSKLMA
jgi:hypothetical protein